MGKEVIVDFFIRSCKQSIKPEPFEVPVDYRNKKWHFSWCPAGQPELSPRSRGEDSVHVLWEK